MYNNTKINRQYLSNFHLRTEFYFTSKYLKLSVLSQLCPKNLVNLLRGFLKRDKLNLKTELNMKNLFVFVLLLLCLSSLFAQESNDTLGLNSLLEPIVETLPSSSIFDDETPLDLTLRYDITSFIRQKAKGEYLPAELRIHLNETDTIIKNIRLKARGNFRRGHCYFPPIYLNFKTDPITTTDLEGIKKIKMVTHCSSSKSYHNYILREYLAYKIFNLLTPHSFRVKLLNISYIDTGKKGKNYKQMGFLIEPLDLLTKRTNSVEVNPNFVKGPDIRGPEMDVVALFNYLIANTDWRAKGGHNMKYIKLLDDLNQDVVPVPYDFDYAGFVGAHYAIPQEWTSIKSTKEREYLGYCRNSEDAYFEAIEIFVAQKDKVIRLIEEFEYFDKKGKSYLMKMVNDFYKLCERPKVMAGVLRRECRGLDF